MDLETLSRQTAILSDMELQSQLAGLSESQKTEFVLENVQGAVDSVKSQKSNKFNDFIATHHFRL